jgi:cytochrome c oxidase subunit I+III
MFEGLAMYLVPVMIGARDMALPRLGALGYWLYLIAGITLYAGFFLGVGPDAGWFAHAPLSSDTSFTPKLGMDVWVAAIGLLEISALIAAVEIIVTIFKARAPGMSMARMPIFVWAMLVMAFMILFAMPAVLLATVAVGLDRMAGTHFFNAAMGGDPSLYQHVFWFFGHPEVYIIFTPALGVVSAVLVTFVRRPIIAYSIVAMSFVAMGLLSFGVWVHHFFAIGIPPIGLSFFAVASMMVSIPSGIQMFAFIGTVWTGRPILGTPFLFLIGFVIIFVLGGVTGVMLAAVPFNWQVHDSYFVVAHLHYVLIGGALFPLFAGLFYWFPKFTGQAARRAPRALAVLDHVRRVQRHLLRPAHPRAPGDGAPCVHLRRRPRLGRVQPRLDDRILRARRRHPPVRGQRRLERPPRPARRHADPWRAPTLEWSVPSPPRPTPSSSRRSCGASTRCGTQRGEPVVRDGRRPRLRLRPQIRQDYRETFGTSLMDAEPESRVNLRGNSLWPLATALAIGVGFVGTLASLWFVPIGAVLFFLAMLGWHWPFSKRVAT